MLIAGTSTTGLDFDSIARPSTAVRGALSLREDLVRYGSLVGIRRPFYEELVLIDAVVDFPASDRGSAEGDAHRRDAALLSDQADLAVLRASQGDGNPGGFWHGRSSCSSAF